MGRAKALSSSPRTSSARRTEPSTTSPAERPTPPGCAKCSAFPPKRRRRRRAEVRNRRLPDDRIDTIIAMSLGVLNTAAATQVFRREKPKMIAQLCARKVLQRNSCNELAGFHQRQNGRKQ